MLPTPLAKQMQMQVGASLLSCVKSEKQLFCFDSSGLFVCVFLPLLIGGLCIEKRGGGEL